MAKGAAVGGDWYDTVVLPDQRMLFVIGDVVGHGMTAAATMGRLRTAFHVLASSESDPGALLEAMSAQVASIPDAFCATIVCALVDPLRKTMHWARAEHLPPLLVGAQGCELLDEPGMPPSRRVRRHLRARAQQAPRRRGPRPLLHRRHRRASRRSARPRTRSSADVAAQLSDLCPGEFCDAVVHALVPEASQRDDIAGGQAPGVHRPRPGVGADQRRAGACASEAVRADPRRHDRHGPDRIRSRPLRALAGGHGRRREFVVVLSELAANAVAASPEGTSAHLGAQLDGGAIVLEAQNGSPRTPSQTDGTWDLADPLRTGGRGL